jgi:serine/threonine protein kinase
MNKRHKKSITPDPYIGLQPLNGYRLVEKIGEGNIGVVYKAQNNSLPDTLACKIIPKNKLKVGWETELKKVIQLRTIPNIVQYHSSGDSVDNEKHPFVWIMWDYIPNINLREYLERTPWPLDMAFIEDITTTILKVLHACHSVGIQHGDLHEGNILISENDSRIVGNPRVIWISDFGCGGSHNQLEPKDDFRQLFYIISNLLSKLKPSDLNPRDKVLYGEMREFLGKRILEIDKTQGSYVGIPERLLRDFHDLTVLAEKESAAASKGEYLRSPGDYLVAEALGYRVEEWKNLFVPEFLAAQDLLSKNITVLTGARGCGKTMTFRRLTKFMDKVIGEPSGVKGSDQFIGFYLNCRDLVEAFPWLPRQLNISKQQQVMHYFHLAWFNEILKTLAICETNRQKSYEWLDRLFIKLFKNDYVSLPLGANVLAHARDFIEREKEKCRLYTSNRSGYEWKLAISDFLDTIQTELELNVDWINDKPLFLFLDDYTIPLVPREVQLVLNPIIFKRRSKLFFKISTEASNSFDTRGIREKPLELHQDFELIDLATESLHQDSKAKEKLLDKIFKPRIDRHPILKGKGLGLVDVLGSISKSNNKLAFEMRDKNIQITYSGAEVFIGMWSSDIRTMIQMFVDMLREANGSLSSGNLTIDKKIQNKVYRSSGGEFLVFTQLLNKPSLWDQAPSAKQQNEDYGRRLREIVEAFINISRYELTKGNLVSNQGRFYPKQAFRIEIIDQFEIEPELKDYYEGLVRWHIFLQDWRGKSIRGMITPRLYLNRILIPFANLTFSSHDSLSFPNNKFNELLKDPKKVSSSWGIESLKKMQQSTMEKTFWEL